MGEERSAQGQIAQGRLAKIRQRAEQLRNSGSQDHGKKGREDQEDEGE